MVDACGDTGPVIDWLTMLDTPHGLQRAGISLVGSAVKRFDTENVRVVKYRLIAPVGVDWARTSGLIDRCDETPKGNAIGVPSVVVMQFQPLRYFTSPAPPPDHDIGVAVSLSVTSLIKEHRLGCLDSKGD